MRGRLYHEWLILQFGDRPVTVPFDREFRSKPSAPQNLGLRNILDRLAHTIERDTLVQRTTQRLCDGLQVDRVVLYYFYQPWRGQVTFEALRSPDCSILGSSGPDDCFNGEYAALYLAGRVRAIADIEAEPIHECHRDFLRNLGVRANLVVPVLASGNLWGLLIAHHSQVWPWSGEDIERMRQGAETLAQSPAIAEALFED